MKSPESESRQSNRLHAIIILVIEAIIALELVFVLLNKQWFLAVLVFGIMLATAAPFLLGRYFRVFIPPEFQVLTVAFVFAALFLGEIRGFYVRIWWWDIALHTSSGLLLGILGFLLVYMLNENANVELSMKPRFVAFFAFLFAVALGALWEIFEFAMDQLLGMNMQKPMLNDPSGLTDTMWDLIVDTIGALIISLLGWWYMRQRKKSWIEAGIREFIDRNPRFFGS
jgi:uncharacterized membrane protein YjdF